ncbi:MAG: ImmA/IrrE family metallo-endopeptidase [Bdellovibrionales bacterium]|nr:ImmA/IrrE family metallo-endopeptidase [Bdellovibrionales bacterium]
MADKVFMPINPAVVKWAREVIGYDIQDAAKKIGVKPAKLEEWERGDSSPTYNQLKKVSSTYKRITAVFFLENIPKDPKIPKDFRVVRDGKEKALSPATLIEVRDAERKRNDAIELATLLGEKTPAFGFKATLSEKAEEVAQKVRKAFSVDTQTINILATEYSSFNFWKSSIEASGALVFQASLDGGNDIRGLAIYYDTFPFILLNTKDLPKPRTFSLLHEFGHLLLQKSKIGNMNPSYKIKDEYNQIEIWCNAFAAECLMPMSAFSKLPEVVAIKSQNDLSRAILVRLSNKFQVSWEAIIRRLVDLGRLSNDYYNSHREEMAKLYGDKKKEISGGPSHQVRVYSYNGEPFTRLAVSNYTAGNITGAELSRYLGLKLNHIEQMSPEISGGRKGSLSERSR